MLIAVVRKNAIMMIDFALEAERKEGKKPEELIYQGGPHLFICRRSNLIVLVLPSCR